VEKMATCNIYLHKSTQEWADHVATVRDTSRSEVIEDMIKYIRDEELEGKVWGKDFYKDEEALEEAEEEEPEEEESEEEEPED